MGQPVLVTGATGFVGSNLARALVDDGRDVRAMTRRPDDYEGPGTAVGADVSDADSLRGALDGVGAAYYLVHALDSDDFEKKDADDARIFAAAAKEAGVEQIIYLGGLGAEGDDLSPHLRSRREVEKLLASTGVPVTALRAAVVIGDGGISWEITRQLVDHLPAMLTPKWVNTRTQPIGLDDLIRYLVGVLDNPKASGRVYEVGGPDVLSYIDMLRRAAAVQDKHVRSVPVPFLSPGLSSHWLALVTDVDLETAQNLIESMTNEVVVRDHSIESLLPGETVGYDEAVRRALAAREARLSHSRSQPQ